MSPRVLILPDISAHFAAIAEAAARSAFPDATITRVDDGRAAAAGSGEDAVVLVLDCVGGSFSESALGLKDSAGLPRWTVVSRGAAAPGGVAIPDEAWTVAALAVLLPVMASWHGARRENGQFRGDLLSIGVRVAHDLRSPLNGIVSGTELIDDYLARTAPQSASLTASLRESTEELSRTISQLSLWARMSAQRLELRPFHMAEPARRAREKFEVRAARSGAVIASGPEWPSVVGDAEASEIVWRALLENALRHAGATPKIEMAWEREGMHYRFLVRDNGPGVEPDKIGSLFRPFHRLHEPDSLRGFGLPIVDRLMQLQGGRCSYEPATKGGAVFSFYLPATG
jgi:signal transduction histidine kinase